MLEMFTDADPMRSDDYRLPADGWRRKNNASEIGGFMDMEKLRAMNLGTVADEPEQEGKSKMNTYDFGYKTLEQVAERVNEGATQGFEHLTSEFLAASYAADTAIEGTEITSDIDADAIEAHLDVLREAGAEFETAEAISIALSLVEQADK